MNFWLAPHHRACCACTDCFNRIQSLLAEFGLMIKKSVKVLRSVLTDVLEDAGNELAGLARLCIERAKELWTELDAHIQ